MVFPGLCGDDPRSQVPRSVWILPGDTSGPTKWGVTQSTATIGVIHNLTQLVNYWPYMSIAICNNHILNVQGGGQVDWHLL